MMKQWRGFMAKIPTLRARAKENLKKQDKEMTLNFNTH